MNAARLKKAKRDVRRSVLAAREALGEAERLARSTRIHERFLSLPESGSGDAGTVMLYWSFGTEVSTPPLIELLHVRGTRLALPRIRGPQDLEPVVYEPGDPLGETSFGAREPACGEVLDVTSIDLVVVPGVAFDRSGRRIGYGGGFYDHFLPRTTPGTPRVSLAFDLQVLDRDLPAAAFDLPVDTIVTETQTVRRPRDARPT